MSRAKRQADELVPVRITAGHVLYVNGRGYGESELAQLPADQAAQLLEQGHAEPSQ